MEAENLREITRIPLKKKNLPEKRKYRRHLWNMLFIELLLQKLQEKEEREAAETEIFMKDDAAAPEIVSCEFTLQMRDNSGLKAVDGIRMMGRDSLELSLYCFESMLSCENYACLAGCVKRTGKLTSSRLLLEAGEIMQEYYTGHIDVVMLEVIIRQYTQRPAVQCSGFNTEDALRLGADLCEIYECFSRANARKAVQMNRNEGKRLVEECGLSWAGTTYYNSCYYYICKEIQAMLQKMMDEAAEEYGIASINFERTEQETRFFMDGGLSFHGVFEWTQMQNNFPSRQYGLKNKGKEPPENFIYLYRNGYSEAEEKGIQRLERKMKKFVADRAYRTEVWRSLAVSGGREYHNGESYLLEEKRMGQEDAGLYRQAMKFLDVFRLYRISGCVELLSAGRK